MQEKKPKQIHTTQHFDQLPLDSLLHVFLFLYSADRVFRWKEVYAPKDTTQTGSKVKTTLRSNYHSLLLMNEFSVYFDLHRRRYQHLRVHRCLLELSRNTRDDIYTYLPLIFVYSTLAVSCLPEPEEPGDYLCCPRDQQNIVLTSLEPHTLNRCPSEFPDPGDMDVVLTDQDFPHVHCDLPNSHYKMILDHELNKMYYGINCPPKLEPAELDTWSIDLC